MRHIVVTFALCLFAISAYAGTYVDNFDDGDFDGWEFMECVEAGAEWKVENGILICKRTSGWPTILMMGENEWRNYSIEFDVKILQALSNFRCVGPDMRIQNVSIPFSKISHDSVYCGLGGWGKWEAFLEVYINNANVKNSKKAFNSEYDRWYRFKAAANEDNFEFYIDGELITSFADSHLQTGPVSIGASGCLAHFDNVVITGDDIPDNTNIAVVSSSGKLATTWGQLRNE